MCANKQELKQNIKLLMRHGSLEREQKPVRKKVHLIAHSMGGLDARYFLSKLDGHKYVFSLTTIASPHRGSALADYLVSNLGGKLKLKKILTFLGIPTEAFTQLTTSHMRQFNEETPDHPDVQYFSFAGGGVPVPALSPMRIFYKKLLKLEGPNDGMVSWASASWGTFVGILPDDHMQQMNWQFFTRRDSTTIYSTVGRILKDAEEKRTDLQRIRSSCKFRIGPNGLPLVESSC